MRAVDQALGAIGELAPDAAEDLNSLAQEFASAALGARGRDLEEGEDAVRALLRSDHTRADTHFIAVCLLRLLNIRRDVLSELGIEREAFGMFDRAFGTEVYESLKIKPESQTFEKRGVLEDAVRSVESDLAETIANLTSFEEMEGVRRELSTRLSRPLPRALVRSFVVPRPLVEGRLQDLFRVAARYRSAEPHQQIAAFDAAMKELTAYHGDAERVGTKYAHLVCEQLSARLERLLQNDYEKSEINQPATADLRAATKKYPLDLAGGSVDIRLEAVVTGPGIARNVRVELLDAEGLQITDAVRNLGNLSRTSVEVSFPAFVQEPRQESTLIASISWEDAARGSREEVVELIVTAQAPVAWESLLNEDPYSLEPVRNDLELAGRRQLLGELLRIARASAAKSAFLFGQKRLGRRQSRRR